MTEEERIMLFKASLELIQKRLIKLSTFAKKKDITSVHARGLFKEDIVKIDGVQFLDWEGVKGYRKAK